MTTEHYLVLQERLWNILNKLTLKYGPSRADEVMARWSESIERKIEARRQQQLNDLFNNSPGSYRNSWPNWE